MSLDNIQIPAIIIQQLYPNSLVDLNTSNTPAIASSTPSISFLGGNQRHLAIVVKEDSALYLPETELDFLLGILAACKLSMADIALINLNSNISLNHTMIAERMNAEKLLLFGADPSEIGLPLNFPHYQVQKFNGQVYLSAPGLKELAGDKSAKTKLWNSLKQVFGIG